jgi:putative flippase GtrA
MAHTYTLKEDQFAADFPMTLPGPAPSPQVLFSPRARLLRFVLTGGIAGLSQLTLLSLLLDRNVPSLIANATAFLIAAQLNFVLSSLFTWRDRVPVQPLWGRWLLFHGSIASMALVNMAVFAAGRPFLPALAASGSGIAVAAIGNFVLGSKLVFPKAAVADGTTGAQAA